MNEVGRPDDDSIDKTIGLGDQVDSGSEVESVDPETETEGRENKAKIVKMRESLERGETTADGTVYPPYNNFPRVIESDGLSVSLALFKTMPGFEDLKDKPLELLERVEKDESWAPAVAGDIPFSRAVIAGIEAEGLGQYRELTEKMEKSDTASAEDVKKYEEYVAKVRALGSKLMEQGFSLHQITK